MSRKKVLREDYLLKLSDGKDRTDVVKIITGMRRCGKTTLMMQFMEELKKTGIDKKRIFHFNLESAEFEDVNDFKDLNALMKKNIVCKDRVYVFFDEIQRVKEWERTINSLMVDYDADIYITGSNAYLLSSELATYMSGRYIEIKMLPLSFKEYISLYPPDVKKDINVRFNDFLLYGALPAIDPDLNSPEFMRGQIEGIYNTVLVKDVLERANIKNTSSLNEVSRFLYSNVGNLTNMLRISEVSNLSSTTVKTYVLALEEAYLFYKAYRFDVKGKKIIKSTEKYYASDVGIRNTVLGEYALQDRGRLLENVVYLELIRRGYKVAVGSYNSMEIDFTAQKMGEIEYFQVTESLIFSSTAEREIRSLDAVNDNYPKTVLSLDKIMSQPGNGIKHLNIIDWLLGRN